MILQKHKLTFSSSKNRLRDLSSSNQILTSKILNKNLIEIFFYLAYGMNLNYELVLGYMMIENKSRIKSVIHGHVRE